MPRDPAHEAVFVADYDSTLRAQQVARAVRPECGAIAGDRTRVTLSQDGASVEVTVTAADLVALRAGLNTWLTLVGTAERALGVDAG